MDFDPRITSDGIGYGAGHGWSCNFHFGHGHDVINEDAVNEKCCVQALRFMIAKADAEINDLEDELAILQCQLKWSESDKQKDPYEVCCATFKQKIDSLTSAIQRLRTENVTRSHVMDEALEIQGPTERIYDIISTLIRHNFSDPNEQSGLTISEESSSDAARYVAKDTKEERCMSKSVDDVTKKAELDAYRCTSEEKSEVLVFKPVGTETLLLASSSEGNSKLDALQQGESEKCITGSETGESGSSPWLAQVVIKAEQDDYDSGINQIAIDSFSKLHDHERDIPVGDPLKSKLHSGLGVVAQSISTSMLKPLGKIGNMKSPSHTENSAQPGSSIKEEGRFSFFQETNMQRKLGDSRAKRQQTQRVGKESANIVSPVYDLDNLKLKISQDPEFLKKLKVAELKEIAKKNKLPKYNKLKKDKMIEELIKLLDL